MLIVNGRGMVARQKALHLQLQRICFTQIFPVIYPKVHVLLPHSVSPNPGFSVSLTATGCITSLPRRHPLQNLQGSYQSKDAKP